MEIQYLVELLTSLLDYATWIMRWLVFVPLVDIAIGVLWYRKSDRAWRRWTGLPVEREEGSRQVQERQLAASVILAQIQALIVGASVILAGVGAFSALVEKETSLVQFSVVWSILWGLFALVGAIWSIGLLPHHTLRTNFLVLHNVAIMLQMSLFCVCAAAARFMVGVIVLFTGS